VGRGRVAGQPGPVEPVGGEGADAVQQPVAGGPVAGRLHAQHRPVGEPGERVGRGRPGDAERGHDPLGRGHRRPAGEAGQGPQPALVVGEELIVAPGDGGGQGPAPLRTPAGRVLEEAEAVVEAPGDLLDRQRLDPGRGQLDGKGQAVQGAADRLHGGGGVAVEGEPPPGPGRPVGEQGHRLREGQRVQEVDGLAVDPQGGLAGGDDPQRRGAVQQPGGQVDHAVDDVLAVVEDEHGLGGREAVEQGLLASGERQRLAHQPRDRGGGVGHLQPDQPDPAAGVEPAHGLEGGAGLADPGRPDQGDQPAAADQPADGGEVLGPPDQGRGQGGQVADDQGRRRGGGRGGVEGGALPQDLALEVGQRPARLDAELVGQQPPHPPAGGERIGLPAGPVQGGGVGGPQAFAQRMLAHQPFQLGDEVAAGPEVDPGRRPVLEQAEPDLLEAGPVGMEPLAVAGVGQDFAPEQGQRLGGGLQRRVGVTVAAGRGRVRGQRGHPEGVDPAGIEGQGVAAMPAGDHGRVGQGPAQLGRLGLEGVAARGRGGLAPQVLDQPLGRDDLPGVQGQADQQLGGLARRHRERPAVAPDLEGAEHPDGEHGSGYAVSRAVSGSSAPRATLRAWPMTFTR
jgi:hypothetical protein